MMLRSILALLAPGLLSVGCATTPDSNGNAAFSPSDEAAVRAAVQRYVAGWLSNEADNVMDTLTDDIVLQPHHGDEPVVGGEAVRAWWFPLGPPTTITHFTVDTERVAGERSLAYAWGRSEVRWDHGGESFRNEGNALSILRKGDDGVWRIAHQIWNDPPSTLLP